MTFFERQRLAGAIYSANNHSSLLHRHTGCRIIKHAHNLFIACNEFELATFKMLPECSIIFKFLFK